MTKKITQYVSFLVILATTLTLIFNKSLDVCFYSVLGLTFSTAIFYETLKDEL